MRKYIKKGYNQKSAAPKGNKYSAGNVAFSGRKHEESTKNIMRVNHKGMKGLHHSKEAKAKMRKAHIKYMISGDIKTKETSIEQKVRLELETRNVKFIAQYPIQSIAVVDFYIPETNTIIQCDGNFWHHSDWAKRYGKDKTDKKQNLYFIEKGYKLFRFTEKEINQSIEKCIEGVLCKEK